MPRPSLDMYIGEKVIAITRGELDHEWGIKLASGAEIRNKAWLEAFRPMGLVNYVLTSISFSERDTSLHFMRGGQKATISFPPTSYVIYDKNYGSEVYPQWDDLLDEIGITANEGNAEPISPPEPTWIVEERRRAEINKRRIAEQARQILQEEEREKQ